MKYKVMVRIRIQTMIFENQLSKAWQQERAPPVNVIFDETRNFVLHSWPGGQYKISEYF